MKKNEKLADAIGLIKDEFVEEAHDGSGRRRFVIPWGLIGKVATAAAVLLLVINIIPFGRKASYSSNSYDYEPSYYSGSEGAMSSYEAYDYEDMAMAPDEAKTDSNASVSELQANKKMILTSSMSIDTKDLNEVIDNIMNAVKTYGAYVQQATNSKQTYDAVIRVPAERYSEFLEAIKATGNTTYYSETVEDITDTYTDLEARLSSLKAQEAKVLEFYDKAESIEDLMSIEARLSEIRYQIEAIEARIKNYDLLVAYSTIHITVRETTVTSTTKEGFFTRIGNALADGWKNFIYSIEDFLVDLSYNIFGIVFFVLIIALGYFLYKKTRNWIRNRKNK